MAGAGLRQRRSVGGRPRHPSQPRRRAGRPRRAERDVAGSACRARRARRDGARARLVEERRELVDRRAAGPAKRDSFAVAGSITYIDGQAPTGYFATVAALPGFSVSIASQTKRSAYGASFASV